MKAVCINIIELSDEKYLPAHWRIKISLLKVYNVQKCKPRIGAGKDKYPYKVMDKKYFIKQTENSYAWLTAKEFKTCFKVIEE
jgi:hypothetical protein